CVPSLSVFLGELRRPLRSWCDSDSMAGVIAERHLHMKWRIQFDPAGEDSDVQHGALHSAAAMNRDRLTRTLTSRYGSRPRWPRPTACSCSIESPRTGGSEAGRRAAS